ncbi:hypothetical protein PUNSTDRAFT_77335 [Punctularia strigosozonata HHB-11173 SS5]|uniref:Uncharacterized protein n=1 Tax=Punctularia strigosozonata (strain HHB-11173) TaxID=741275 RepID=R7S0T9_PUNST|nr:uncharacterized protein PUNSTDRAFT_77335 [Punctularia strigosozonata HHB-11173 SS5]EIN03823.1 hypothetical protein PUNSTDRAFT_77335 [Punctularia strigosozonata HHB-11173 SS5]
MQARPEPRRTLFSSVQCTPAFLKKTSDSHPFTQQIDVIIPTSGSDSDALRALQKLESAYAKTSMELSDLLENLVAPYRRSYYARQGLIALSQNSDADGYGAWCLDPRGMLTLALSKETYGQSRLAGRKLCIHRRSDMHLVNMYADDREPKTYQKQLNALRAWEARRAEEGYQWEMLYYCPVSARNAHRLQKAKPEISMFNNVHVPIITSDAVIRPSREGDHDAVEDWEEHMASLFEWSGMAALGAQRLQVVDCVDPYVAVYEPPAPSRAGEIMHLRWRGFFPPDFVWSVLEHAVNIVSAAGQHSSESSFVSITAHGFSQSPITYIPQDTCSWDARGYRYPRKEAEDTWSLLIAPRTDGANGGVQTYATLVESIGEWDTRWG